MFYIDLDAKFREIFELDLEEFRLDLNAENVTSIEAYNAADYDRKYFASHDEAESWLERHEKIWSALSNEKICVSRDLPAILYKRRYIVRTLLGEKMQTLRKYRKNWQRGDLVNLHDQTFFLTVEIKKISEVDWNGEKMFRYDFKLP